MSFKIVINSNTAFSIYNFRLGLMNKLKEKGYTVIAVAPYDKYAEKIKERGFKFFPIKNLDRKGKNPLKDFKLFMEYLKLYRQIQPDLVINFTIKPNIYSSLAAGILEISSISVVTGLGYVFIKNTFLTKIVENLYKLAFKFNSYIVFQNKTDLEELKYLTKGKEIYIPSSGINLQKFSPEICKEKSKNNPTFTFLFIGRFLKDKGIFELIEAGKKLYQAGLSFELWLLGSVDKGNPSSLTEQELAEIKKIPFVKVFPFTEDVRPYICASDCVVLPSYREGVPRSLLEAMAMEKPIITTDAPGCRDVCINGLNCFLVKPRDIESLYIAMKNIIKSPLELRVAMGKKGRKIVEEKYSEDIVVSKYLELIEKILQPSGG
jgi:glycosyltransferase involved in cell wall biosynthesis